MTHDENGIKLAVSKPKVGNIVVKKRVEAGCNIPPVSSSLSLTPFSLCALRTRSAVGAKPLVGSIQCGVDTGRRTPS